MYIYMIMAYTYILRRVHIIFTMNTVNRGTQYNGNAETSCIQRRLTGTGLSAAAAYCRCIEIDPIFFPLNRIPLYRVVYDMYRYILYYIR